MSKLSLSKPVLIMTYGFPGAGKSAFARQLSGVMNIVHLQADRIRHELFEQPRYDKQENEVVGHLMDYMTEEFLSAGVSVVYDATVDRLAQRRLLRDLARKMKAEHLLIWLQIDTETAFARTQRRDRRKSDDRYAQPFDRDGFESRAKLMQNPRNEDYIVISGKHTFNTQRSAVVKRLYEMGLIDAGSASSKVVKPGLINLIPNPLGGRVDPTRRNIVIR